VDKKLTDLVKTAKKEKYNIIITADHGNAEEMLDLETGELKTTHTTNPVPFIVIASERKIKLRKQGKLADVAPTILDLMETKKPSDMTGESLIK